MKEFFSRLKKEPKKQEAINFQLLTIKELTADPGLMEELTILNQKAFGTESSDPFFQSGSSHLLIARGQKGKAIGMTVFMARKVGEKGNEGGIVRELKEYLEKEQQPPLPNGRHVLFLNNGVSIKPGTGTKMIGIIKKEFNPIILSSLTRSAKAVKMIEKGLGNDFVVCCGGADPRNLKKGGERYFTDHWFSIAADFNNSHYFLFAFSPDPAKEEEVFAVHYYRLSEELQGEVILPNKKYPDSLKKAIIETMLCHFKNKDGFIHKDITMPVTAFSKELLRLMENYQKEPYRRDVRERLEKLSRRIEENHQPFPKPYSLAPDPKFNFVIKKDN